MQIVSSLKTLMHKMIMGTALSLALTGPVLALDQNALVSRIQETIQAKSLVLKNTGVDVDGDRVVLRDVVITSPEGTQKPDMFLMPVGDIILNKVQEGADGSYTIGQISVGNIDFNEKNDKGTERFLIQGIKAADVYISPRETDGQTSQRLPYSRLTIEKFAFDNNGKNLLTSENISTSYSKTQPGNLIENAFSVGSFAFDPSGFPGEDVRKTLGNLGYNKLEGNMTIATAWDPSKGDFNLSQYKVVIKHGGTLNLAMRASGVTADLLAELQQVHSRMQNAQKDKQVNVLAILGLAQQINVGSIRIRYDDNSLVNRLLDYRGKSSGKSRKQVVSEVKFALSSIANQVKHPDFSNRIIKETGAFLDNPKSLEISATPENPIPFAIIAATAVTLPQKLIDIFNINIAANK